MLRVFRLFNNHSKNVFSISCSWLLGLIAGLLVALRTATTFNSWTLSLQYSDLSVIGFLATLIFPYLLSAILFRVSTWKAVLPLIFLKAFSYSWCAIAIVRVFVYSGWLLRLLLLFSDSLSVVLLLWFWIRNCNSDTAGRHRDLLLCLVLTLIIGCVDCSLISPFGVYLLSYF